MMIINKFKLIKLFNLLMIGSFLILPVITGFPSLVNAQSLDPVTSTPTLSVTEDQFPTPTPPAPVETIPNPDPVADTAEPLPIPTVTETPTLEPVATELTPTATETPSPSPTVTITPGLLPGEINWTIVMDIPISAQELRNQGGVIGGELHLEDTLTTEIEDSSVSADVDPLNVTGSSATYRVVLSGSGGLDQFRKTIFEDLQNQFNLLGGAIVLTVSGHISKGQVIPLILESNLSTGYLWELVSYDPTLLAKEGNPVFEPKAGGIGMPSRELIHLRGLAEGETTITIRYRQPFDRAENPTRWITIQSGDFPAEVNLTSPFSESMRGPSSPVMGTDIGSLTSDDPSLSLPATFDWASQGKVTSVRNQGACGSCWAFGTVGVMEAAIKIQSGLDVDLSEQFLVSCNNDNWSCNGGWWANDYHTNRLANSQSLVGAVLESDMPYTATNGTCQLVPNHPYKLSNWYSVAGNTVPSVDAIKNAITSFGPVASAVCVGNGFSSYRSGVFSTNEIASCNGGVNHAVVLTGWDDATQSWVLRNSWGTGWGESGYMRIKWGTSNVGYASNYVVYTGGSNPVPTAGPSPTPTPTSAAPLNDDVSNSHRDSRRRYSSANLDEYQQRYRCSG